MDRRISLSMLLLFIHWRALMRNIHVHAMEQNSVLKFCPVRVHFALIHVHQDTQACTRGGITLSYLTVQFLIKFLQLHTNSCFWA